MPDVPEMINYESISELTALSSQTSEVCNEVTFVLCFIFIYGIIHL
jgi:hypothetical protein